MSIRLTTLNTQLLPLDGLSNLEAVNQRARRIAAAFLADPWPDVLVFNEVFFEPARQILASQLAAHWPHIVAKLGPTRTLAWETLAPVVAFWKQSLPPAHPLRALALQDLYQALIRQGLELPEDSGLMVLSRYPLVGDPVFVPFEAAESVDQYADKGAVLVAVDHPLARLNLVATHLQAAYASQDEFAPVRRAQLAQIAGLIERDGRPASLNPGRPVTVVAGDLNVQGAGQPRKEYEQLFANPDGLPFFGQRLADCWERFIAPAALGWDPGITHGWDGPRPARLDYVLLMDERAGHQGPPLVAQHMKIGHHGLSDHASLSVEIDNQIPFCYPAAAFEPPADRQAGRQTFELPDGSMAWLRFRQPGVYTFVTDPQTEVEVYLSSNLSQPLEPAAETDLSQIPAAGPATQRHAAQDPEPISRSQGTTFSVGGAEGMVRVFRPGRPGPAAVGWYRHGAD